MTTTIIVFFAGAIFVEAARFIASTTARGIRHRRRAMRLEQMHRENGLAIIHEANKPVGGDQT